MALYDRMLRSPSPDLSPVKKETDDHDDDYEDYHIPIKIETFHYRGRVARCVETVCGNGLYDIRCADDVRNVAGAADAGEIDRAISMTRYTSRRPIGSHATGSERVLL